VVEGREVGDRLSVYRFHILDPIPFRKSFKLEIEHWPWISTIPNTGRGYYSSAGFWYQSSIHAPWPRLARIISNEAWDPDKGRWHVKGCIEAEELAVSGFESKAGPGAKPAVRKELPNLSGDHMLFFDSGGAGELSLAVPVEKEGRYDVTVYFVRTPECGIVDVSINGESVGDPADTFKKTDDLTRPIWPPKPFLYSGIRLRRGTNTFRFSINSRNPKSAGFKVGVDCLVLEEKKAR
jgi:hypothetical protein